MELFEAIEKRRSVRNLDEVDIPKEDLEKIVNAGRIAPSGSNIQPREFIIITDSEKLRKLSEIQEALGEVSAAIAVVCDPEKSNWWVEDMAASVENMLLTIVALGYDSVWIEGTLLSQEKRAKEILEVPEKKRLVTILPIGEASEEERRAEKKPLAEITHYEKYGNKTD
ncbi:MAG: nitroreductase family protein [Candidatus Hadarchaeia archaeon]